MEMVLHATAKVSLEDVSWDDADCSRTETWNFLRCALPAQVTKALRFRDSEMASAIKSRANFLCHHTENSIHVVMTPNIAPNERHIYHPQGHSLLDGVDLCAEQAPSIRVTTQYLYTTPASHLQRTGAVAACGIGVLLAVLVTLTDTSDTRAAALVCTGLLLQCATTLAYFLPKPVTSYDEPVPRPPDLGLRWSKPVAAHVGHSTDDVFVYGCGHALLASFGQLGWHPTALQQKQVVPLFCSEVHGKVAVAGVRGAIALVQIRSSEHAQAFNYVLAAQRLERLGAAAVVFFDGEAMHNGARRLPATLYGQRRDKQCVGIPCALLAPAVAAKLWQHCTEFDGHVTTMDMREHVFAKDPPTAAPMVLRNDDAANMLVIKPESADCSVFFKVMMTNTDSLEPWHQVRPSTSLAYVSQGRFTIDLSQYVDLNSTTDRQNVIIHVVAAQPGKAMSEEVQVNMLPERLPKPIFRIEQSDTGAKAIVLTWTDETHRLAPDSVVTFKYAAFGANHGQSMHDLVTHGHFHATDAQMTESTASVALTTHQLLDLVSEQEAMGLSKSTVQPIEHEGMGSGSEVGTVRLVMYISHPSMVRSRAVSLFYNPNQLPDPQIVYEQGASKIILRGPPGTILYHLVVDPSVTSTPRRRFKQCTLTQHAKHVESCINVDAWVGRGTIRVLLFAAAKKQADSNTVALQIKFPSMPAPHIAAHGEHENVVTVKAMVPGCLIHYAIFHPEASSGAGFVRHQLPAGQAELNVNMDEFLNFDTRSAHQAVTVRAYCTNIGMQQSSTVNYTHYARQLDPMTVETIPQQPGVLGIACTAATKVTYTVVRHGHMDVKANEHTCALSADGMTALCNLWEYVDPTLPPDEQRIDVRFVAHRDGWCRTVCDYTYTPEVVTQPQLCSSIDADTAEVLVRISAPMPGARLFAAVVSRDATENPLEDSFLDTLTFTEVACGMEDYRQQDLLLSVHPCSLVFDRMAVEVYMRNFLHHSCSQLAFAEHIEWPIDGNFPSSLHHSHMAKHFTKHITRHNINLLL